MLKDKPEKGILTGEIQLSPIQKWFFQKNWDNINYFNQATLLILNDKITIYMVKAIFNILLQYHDMLRARYEIRNDKYYQFYSDYNVVEVEEKIFNEVDNLDYDIHIESTKTQNSLNIFHGPIIKVVLYRCPDGNERMLIVAHHLVVDGVSWRIIIDDIETIYRSFKETGKASLPSKTYSYRQWVSQLIELAKSETIQKEITYWKDVESHIKEDVFLKKDAEISSNDSIDFCMIELNKDDTYNLIYNALKKNNVQINDILLTALTLAAGDITGSYNFSFSLEGHGREDVIGLDVTRTVGWFTTVFPVFLKISEPTNIKNSIKEVMSILSEIPNKGIGYGIIKYYTGQLNKSLPRISFNYLGQWDAGISDNGVFRYAPESSGEDCDNSNEFFNLIDINGGIKNNLFEMSFAYKTNYYKRETIATFSNLFKKRLQEIIRYAT